jgi:hypothetical protein
MVFNISISRVRGGANHRQAMAGGSVTHPYRGKTIKEFGADGD